FGVAAAVALARLARAAAERDRTRGLRRCGSRSLWASGLFMAPVSIVAPALLFACLLGCPVAMASFSKSAPRLSRCLHHHNPSARRPGGPRPRRRPTTQTACSLRQ